MMDDRICILVVEDDDALRDALCTTLECAGHRAQGAADGPAALALMERNLFHLVVSDLRMAPMDGLALLAEVRRRDPALPVLLMTAFGDVDKAVAAMRGGACDFLLKPFEPRVLIEHVERYAAAPPPADGLVAEDPRTRQVLSLAARVARSDATVLLSGESGTGKEVFARYLHAQSARAAAPFVAINCAAIPENLLEATLFGYEKGAFTGAQSGQAGKFEQAQEGTLLLGWTSASSPPPTATWRSRWPRAAFARISSIGSTSSRYAFRPCGNAGRTSFPWRRILPRFTVRAWAAVPPLPPPRRQFLPPTTGRATSGNWRTRCSAR